ncbi:hypothetical protein B4U79_06888 [Dinothrombium tinctorium]|uniref:Uncharacterized protein n=1 Tax=Dinothrombium tinctorium TaxID=1965070 RepID=A0A3S3NUL2_9ACAR|nr:hypothetical protein B4U79_13694 [Dinothrombium tinctorium]RWS09111.1 hypothetical protein B4U79_06888 [Dinothrombium tinctorium]
MFTSFVFLLITSLSFGYLQAVSVQTNGAKQINSNRLNFSRSSDLNNANAERQFPDGSYLIPNMVISTVVPIAVIIGIGIVLLKMLIFGLWMFGRSSFGGFGNFGYGGYPPYSPTAYSSSAWRGDAAAARSLHNKNGSPVSPLISPTVMSLISKVSEALEKYGKRL